MVLLTINVPSQFNFNNSIQQHAQTREQQVSTWADLVLRYHSHHKQTTLSLNDATLPLFNNADLKRQLPTEGRQLILDHLEKRGNAAAMDKKRQQWEIYWHALDEWATIIYQWATANGMTNTVCTLFELTAGDASVGEEFHGLDEAVLRKALQNLEQRQKCELISIDDSEGVKFF